MTAFFILKLYISNSQSNAQDIINGVVSWCDRSLLGHYDLSIIDLSQSPELAEQVGILVTPTLVKEQPFPVQRLVGDMSNLNILLPERHLNGNSSRS
jgi:circadian clock protein KaiB